MDQGIDLRSLKTASGQDAFDRYKQLHGEAMIGKLTMAQQLSKLIQSKEYKKLPTTDQIPDELNNPRVLLTGRIVGAYRHAAFQQLLKEVPGLKEAYIQHYKDQMATNKGRVPGAVQ